METDYYTKIERLFSSVVGVVYRFAKAYLLLIFRPFFAPFYLTWGYTAPERREIGPVTTALTSYFLSFLFFLFFIARTAEFTDLHQIFARGLLYPEIDDQKSAAALALAGAVLTTVLLYAGMTSISAALAHFEVFGDDFEKLRDDFRTSAMYATANISFALPLVIGITEVTNVFGIDPGKILYIIVHGRLAGGMFGWLDYIVYGFYIILFVMGLYALLDGMSLAKHFLGKGGGFLKRSSRLTLIVALTTSIVIFGSALGGSISLLALSNFLQHSGSPLAVNALCTGLQNQAMIYAEVTNAGKQTVILSPDSVQAPDTTESDIITPGFSSHKVQYQVENNQLLKQAIILPGEKKHLVMIFGSPADSRPVHRKSAPGSRGKPVLYPTKRPDQAAPNNVECSFGLYYTVLGGYSERSLLKVNGAGHF